MFQITNLDIKNYKQFQNKSFKFSKGINIIYGENEAGKSTTIDAILTLFYADPTTSSKVLLEYIHSWGGVSKPELRMDGINNGEIISVEKNFNTRKSFLKTRKNSIEDNKKVTSEISAMLGISSGEVFKSVAVFRGSEMAASSENGKLKENLMSLSTGEDVNALNALKNIEKEIDSISRGIDRYSKNPGRLKVLEDTLVQKRTALSELKRKLNEYNECVKLFTEAHSELEFINTEIKNVEEILDKNTELLKSKDQLKKLEKDLDNLGIQIAETEQLEKQIKDKREELSGLFDEGFSKSEFDEKLATLKNRLTESNELIKTLRSTLSAKNEEKEASLSENQQIEKGLKIGSFINLPNISLLVLAFGAIAAIPIYSALTFTSSIVAFVSIILLLLNCFRIWRNGIKGKVTEPEVTYDSTQLVIEKDIKNAEEDLKNIENEIVDFWRKSVFGDEKKYLKICADANKLEIEINSLKEISDQRAKSFKEKDLGSYKDSLLSKQRDLILAKNELTITKIEKLSNYEVDGERYAELEGKYQKLLARKKIEDQKYLANFERSKVLHTDSSLITSLEEEIYGLENEVSLWTKKLNALQLSLKYLNFALKSTTKGASDKIKETLDRNLSKITSGKYSKCIVDDNFNIRIYSNEKSLEIEPSVSLSSGAVEQIYFLAKLSFLYLLSNQQNPPILLDDPFITFDENRTELAFELLRSISENNQIIFFTCHKQYLQYADNIIEL